MAILHGFAARCLFGVVFLHYAKQSRLLCTVSTHQSLPHQRTAHHESTKSLRPAESLIFSPRHRYCDLSFVGKVFEKRSVLGNLTCAQET